LNHTLGISGPSDAPSQSLPRPGTAGWSRLLWGAVFLGLVGMVVALQYPGFDSPLIYDSRGYIGDRVQVFATHDLLAVIRIIPARPLLMTSFFLNYSISGMDPAAFRWFNAVLCAATGTILLLLYQLLLESVDPEARTPLPEVTSRQDSSGGKGEPASHPDSRRTLISLVLAGLFVVHPLQTTVVLYVIQREAALACFFYVSALTAYLAVRSGRWRHATSGYAVTSALFCAGMLCKENVATFPLVAGMAELILFRQTLSELPKRVLTIIALTVPPAVGYLLLTSWLHEADSVHPSGIVHRLLEHYGDSGLTVAEVVLTESRVLFSYLGMILAPFVMKTELIRAETISRSLWNPPTTLAAVAGLALLLGIGIRLIRRRPLIAFGILFFLVTSLPECLLIPQFLFFGNRTILPMVGLLLCLGDGCLVLLNWADTRRKRRVFSWGAGGLAVTGVLALSALTYSQATEWRPGPFWSKAFSRLPPWSHDVEMNTYETVLLSHGGELVGIGDYQGAVAVLSRAIDLACRAGEAPSSRRVDPEQAVGYRKPNTGSDSRWRDAPSRCPEMKPDYYIAFNLLGMAMERQGKLSEALDLYRDALALNPGAADAYSNVGQAMLKLGRTGEAIESYRNAIQHEPRHAAAHNGLGEAMLRTGKVTEAMELFRKAIDINPAYGDAYNNLGNAFLSIGDTAQAKEHYLKGIALKPNSPELHNNLGAAYLREKRLNEAELEFRRAVAIRPQFAKAWLNLAIALLQQGKYSGVTDYLNKAIEIDPTFAPAHLYLGQVLESSGNPEQAAQAYGTALDLQPDMTDAHYRLAHILKSLHNEPLAIRHYQAALALNPEHWIAHSELGELYLNVSELGKAVQHLEKALEIRPDALDVRNNLETALQRVGSTAKTEGGLRHEQGGDTNSRP
jgi:protein O-mannosyl-transferase